MSTRAFRNWSGVHQVTPARWATPSSEAAVAALLRGASEGGRRVKAIGSGHSWSDIALAHDVLVDLRRLRRVKSIDAAARTITVEAGCTIERVSAALDEVGLALPILGSIGKQTVAGATSTGTHGSSLMHGNLATLITRLRLATPSGDVVELDESHPWMPAARVGIGALGVLTELTLRAVPAFDLEEETLPLPFAEAAERALELARSAEFVKLWWFPSTGTTQVFRYRRTPVRATRSPVSRWVDEKVVNQTLFEAALRVAGVFPSATQAINAVVASAYLKPGRRVLRSTDAFHVALPPVHREAEHAYALEETSDVLFELDAMIRRGALRVNMPIEVRFVRGDDAWMSPASGRDTCQVGVYQAQSADLRPLFEGADAIASKRRARPHWGKETALDHRDVLRAYPQADRFLDLRATLDGRGTMLNPYLERMLGVG